MAVLKLAYPSTDFLCPVKSENLYTAAIGFTLGAGISVISFVIGLFINASLEKHFALPTIDTRSL
jgi:hypothetical protein